MRKGTLFRTGQCAAALSPFRVIMKNYIFVRKGYVFCILLKRCDKACLVFTELREICSFFSYVYCISAIYTKVAEICVLIDNIGKGHFLTGHSEKGYNVSISKCRTHC